MKIQFLLPLTMGLFITLYSPLHAQDVAEGLNMYLIERDIPDAGKLDSDQLKGISKTSCDVLSKMNAEDIKWIESYITEDKIYCRYLAKNEELLKEHAEKGGFPISKITLIKNQIDPSLAED